MSEETMSLRLHRALHWRREYGGYKLPYRHRNEVKLQSLMLTICIFGIVGLIGLIVWAAT